MSSFFGRLKGNSIPVAQSSITVPITPLDKLRSDLSPVKEDGSDKFFGFENFGSTCYCNSIIQCLFYSVPFREQVLNFPPRATPVSPTNHSSPFRSPVEMSPRKYQVAAMSVLQPPMPLKPEDKNSPEYKKKMAMTAGPVLHVSSEAANAYGMTESLFTSLKDIFESIIHHNSRTGVVSPTIFLENLKRENEMFRTAMHQDAHEFLNLLLNQVVENVEQYVKEFESARQANGATGDAATQGSNLKPVNSGWVHEIFEGTLTSETRCLTCENVSHRDEPFLDLPVDLDQHSSVTSCLRKFSQEEMLRERNKFHCDNCGGLQEAEKRMKIKRLPRILALHLKRFKYTEDLQRLQKLFHRVVYPYYLRLFNTTDDAEDPDRLYELYAVVVHIGGGPYHGHYVAIIKTPDRGWWLFDDEMVEPVDKSFVRNFFGGEHTLACAYVLFYQETTVEAMNKEQEADSLETAAAAAAATVVSDHRVSEMVSPITKEKDNGVLANGSHHIQPELSSINEDYADKPNPADDDVAVFPKPPVPGHENSTDHPPIPSTPKFGIKKPDLQWRRDHGKDDNNKKEEKARKAAEKEQEKLAKHKKKHEPNNHLAPVTALPSIDRLTHWDQGGPVDSAAADGADGHKNSGLSRLKQGSKSFRGKPKLWLGKDKNERDVSIISAPGVLTDDTHELAPTASAPVVSMSSGAAATADKSVKPKVHHRFGIGKKKSTPHL